MVAGFCLGSGLVPAPSLASAIAAQHPTAQSTKGQTVLTPGRPHRHKKGKWVLDAQRESNARDGKAVASRNRN